ncbi:alanine dehydrogenase [Bacillus canaveralius]|uniref:Alanine dehydrogenase n=1 Tax=Bacillus canaveralius TaxID=1403243 RepID=A0A2N5GKU8_9BACI|nr:alanine dehydrogenase [Bacillus canaveralius]PLR82078.1 alanine dehydrogenase [Bacillus canaveralius]PLR98016.1 alanine dehydrogenase [Bacillus canaveralius]
MIIGVPKEIKNNENRVALTPAGADTLIRNGHHILIETNAGTGSGFEDCYYSELGCEIVENAQEVWSRSNMVMKVKEPLPEEYSFFRENLILFTYLHLAAEIKLSYELMKSGMTAIAYETIQLENGTLPLLTPMSEVAGRMAPQIGAQFLEKPRGGKGILLSGVPGVNRGKVTIIGGGVVGNNAAKMALGLGADVTIIDLNPDRLRQLDDLFGRQIQTLISNPMNISHSIMQSDLVIGGVLIPGAKAPILVTEEMVKQMKSGSVIVDVAIDQGGIVETIDHITTHDNPMYTRHGIVHYAVANMPGAVPRTSTIALTNSTVPYALKLANSFGKAIRENLPLAKGVNVLGGYITNRAVAHSLGCEFRSLDDLLLNSVAV